MNKVVYQEIRGYFILSKEAIDWFKSKNIEIDKYLKTPNGKLPRHHPLLIQCLEELGQKAARKFTTLALAEVSEKYMIDHDDIYGQEYILEPTDAKFLPWLDLTNNIWFDSNNIDYENE